MSQTYVSASDRDIRRTAERSARFHRGHLLLALTSILGILVVGLAYAGRLSGFGQAADSQQSVHVTNLNTVSNSKELEPLFERLFANTADRRFAAQNLFDF